MPLIEVRGLKAYFYTEDGMVACNLPGICDIPYRAVLESYWRWSQ